MRKRNNNLTKQILTLMLAFVMVFTGMGIGGWGVDTAWAGTVHYYPTITYTDQNDNVTKITLTSNESIGEWSYGADNKSDLFLVSLPGNAEITSLTLENVDSSLQTWEIAGAKKYLEIEGEYPKISEIRSSAEFLVNGIFRECEYDDDECNYGYLLQDFGIGGFKDAIPMENVEGYIVYCWISGGPMKNDIATPGIIIQYPLGGSDETIDNEIEEKVGEKIISEPENWYHENDKFNGRQFSSTGFWTDMQASLLTARGVLGNSDSTEEDKATAISKLKEKIANLIPISQINTTALYEAARTEWVWTGSDIDNKLENKADVTGGSQELASADTCTLATWTPYAQAVSDADALLKELFDKDKKATEKNNSADKQLQAEIEKIVKAADETKLVRQSAYDYAYTYYQNNKAEMEALLTQYDPKKLTEKDYIPKSWKRYSDAYTALKQTADYRIVGGTTEDYAALKKFAGYSVYDENEGYVLHPAQLQELKEARRQLVSAEDVTVSLTYVNNFSALYPAFLTGGTNLYVNKTATFKKGNAALTTETLEKAGITFDLHDDKTIAAGENNKSDTSPFFLIFINDENYGIFRDTVLNNANLQLHKDDEVRVVRICQPAQYSEASTGYDTSAYSEGVTYDEKHYQDSVAQIHMSAPKTVKIGDKVSFTAAVTGVNTSNQGKALEADQISLFISEPQQDGSLAEPTVKTKALTDADGKLEYVFTKPGSYTVAMYKVVTDKFGSTSIYNKVTAGEYYSLYAGDYMQITVEAADEDALLKQYRSENLAKAKAFYESFQAHDFAAGYYDGEFKDAYNKLKTNQTAADTFEALMKRFEEDYAELETCAQQKVDHAAIIADLRTNLSYLPESSDQWDSNDKTVLQTIKEAYQNLNSYQKTLLSSKEISTLDEIAAYDLSSLPPQATVQVKLVPQGEFLSATDNGDTGAAQYGKPNQNRISHVHPDGSKTKEWYDEGYQPLMSVWEKTAHPGDVIDIWRYLKTNDTLYRPVWSSDGKTWHELKQTTLKNVHGADYPDYYIAQIPITEDMAGGSLTITLKMVDKATYESMTAETQDEIDAAKTAALEALEAAYKAYQAENYTDENWDTLTKAYEKGKTDITDASATETIAEARRKALAAMAAVPAKSGSATTPGTEPGSVTYDSGATIGKVHVIIENSVCPMTESSSKNGNKTEFDTKKAGLYGTFIDKWYDLGEKDTMMSCILKALQLEGYGWEGTGGDGYGITYIAGIFKDTDKDGKLSANENILSEFDGGAGAGWMGTLNDWFVNEGFHAFTAKNGALENGDEIHVMYTTNLGVDIGGTWYNENTSLEKLQISGGTLSPSFSGSQTEYTLVISKDKAEVTVTPTAANKNYQARIFLNSYNKDSARYKMTETISVKSGDILYVGVGEKGWPTMNAGGVGTKYTIKVVSGSDSTAVAKMLKALKDITYANYKAEKGNVEAARAAYNALTDKSGITAEDLKKLTDAEAQIKFYSEIDDVKAKFAALKATSSESAARDAYNAYKKLSAEQQEYITIEDSNIYNELAKKYNLSSVAGSAEMPESEVVTEGKTGSAVTTSPAEVKMSGTTGTVTVKADNQKEILKQAKEKKSAQVVLVVANSDAKGAEKLELNLDKSFLESLLKDTNAKLIVKTPLGQKTYEREELQKLVNEATGTTVKSEINKDNVDTQTEEPADDNAAKIEKAKSIVKNMKLTARSSKTAKKNIKAVLKSDAKVKASIKELKDLGFTVKYRFYRSTKKAASYKAAVTKKTAAYTNTSGKKGTKYFYKVQVRVYDENGKLIAKTALKQCKYASRTWTKAK